MEDQDLLDHLEDLISEEKWLRQQAIERALGTGDPRAADDDEVRRLADVAAQLDRCWNAMLQRATSLNGGMGDHGAGTPGSQAAADHGPLQVQR